MDVEEILWTCVPVGLVNAQLIVRYDRVAWSSAEEMEEFVSDFEERNAGEEDPADLMLDQDFIFLETPVYLMNRRTQAAMTAAQWKECLGEAYARVEDELEEAVTFDGREWLDAQSVMGELKRADRKLFRRVMALEDAVGSKQGILNAYCRAWEAENGAPFSIDAPRRQKLKFRHPRCV